MNRRRLLLATASSAIATTKTTAAASVAAPNIEKFAHQPIVGWQIELSSDTREVDSHTALFVLGKCECAVPEIAKLNLPISTIGYLDGSVHWPSSGDFFAEGWNIGRKRISKIDDAMEFAKRTIEANDRVILLGNFSAPFASEMLVTLATMARYTNRSVIAIGGTPAPGAQGEIRTQRGWTCIEELRRIGCCVTTVPEVDFYSDQFEQVDSVAASKLLGVDEGSPYCRALELALNQVDFTIASIGEDLLASKFSAGNLVSLGWGYAANGNDAAVAANMALVNGYGLSKTDNRNVSAHILVTSSGDEILAHLRTSSEIISYAFGRSAPVYFGASHNARVTNKALQVTVFR